MNRNTKIGLGVALVVLLVGAGVAYWALVLRESPPPPPVAVEAPVADAGAPAVNVDEGDALLKQLAKGLSGQLEKYLSEESLLRRLVAATAQIADGESPRTVLVFLAPKGEYAVTLKKEKSPPKKLTKAQQRAKAKSPKVWFVDPKGWARYDSVTGTLTSIDPRAAGEVYTKIRPYAEAAYAEIGRPGTTLDGKLRLAIATLVAAPVPPPETELVEKGALYQYADPKLEGLTAAQKHLLRFGPKNQSAVQEWLKKLEAALPPTT
jgi:hypothetical protein